jgi:exodeoxyribonuclease VII large subunit
MTDTRSPGPMTVSELTLAVKLDLEREFCAVWVAGEVTRVTKHASGHVYFTMKDAGAQLSAMMFRSDLARLKFELRDGMVVVARGRLSVYPPRGNYQLQADRLEPQGVGAQELALRQLREKLLAKGYFDSARKKPLPAFPRRIALVTSPSGAAVRDMLQVLTTRWPVGDIILCPVRVQGEGAAQEIAAAIRLLNRCRRERTFSSDVIIVGRGGGSAEDLWAFNEEIVADAIFASTIPVVSAVGHEIDVTISDHVADVHALTPTDAANKVVPDRSEFVQAMRGWRNRLENAIERRLTLVRNKLDALAAHSVLRRPLSRVRERESRLDQLATRLHRAVKLKTARAGASISALAGRLETLSPLNVLQRGYSLTRTEDNAALVRNAALLQPGDRLLTRLARGSVVSRVEQVIEESS